MEPEVLCGGHTSSPLDGAEWLVESWSLFAFSYGVACVHWTCDWVDLNAGLDTLVMKLGTEPYRDEICVQWLQAEGNFLPYGWLPEVFTCYGLPASRISVVWFPLLLLCFHHHHHHHDGAGFCCFNAVDLYLNVLCLDIVRVTDYPDLFSLWVSSLTPF